MKNTLNNPNYNPTLGFPPVTTISQQYIGANGENGATVYKPTDTNIFKMCQFMTTNENINTMSFKSDNYIHILNGIENDYEITKNIITDITKHLDTHKLYNITFNNYGNITTFYGSGRKKRKFTKTDTDNISEINEFNIVKSNPNGQYFTFKLITIVSNHKVEWFIENKLFDTKVKMRVFNLQQFEKVS